MSGENFPHNGALRAHGFSSCPTGRRQPGRLLQVSPCLEPATCQGPALSAYLSSLAGGMHTPASLGSQEGEGWVPPGDVELPPTGSQWRGRKQVVDSQTRSRQPLLHTRPAQEPGHSGHGRDTA